jgi:membrane protein implicated in regulation of membrane protease activity
MGMFIILALILVWVMLIASFSATIGGWHWAVQLAVYVVAGIVWILPLKPLLRWMETGAWR